MHWRPKSTKQPQTSKVAKSARPPAASVPAQAGKLEKKAKQRKLSNLRKPADMSLEAWQIELRRQFGRQQDFELKNLGEHAIFSEFDVTNPNSQRTYRVHIRGTQPGDNYCACADFATNTLGTCKHIEFTLARLERKRGGAEALRAGFQPAYSEVFLQYGARREVRFRPGAECPPELARLAAKYFGTDGILLPEAYGQFDQFLGGAGDLDHELRCHEDVLGFVAEVRDAARREARVVEAFPRGSKSPAFKDLLKVPLYDYQREGALFAARVGRCLIGDDMGLGKTIQAIAAAEIMARLFGVERVLIICPTSLKHQWEREIERFTERSCAVINGDRPQRAQGFATNSFFKVMNYDTVYRDLDLIGEWGPDLVILDEAQRIKNWSTRVARSVKRIVSPYAIVLTGTPLENRLEELISIVQFVDRFRLGPTFKLLHEHQLRDEFGKVIGYRELDRIGQTLKPILVRRHKDQVLDQLPERIDTTLFVPMTERQKDLHEENREIVARVVERWRRLGFLTESDQRRLMIALQKMRMACDNSYLVEHVGDQGPKADEAVTLLNEIFEQPNTKVVIFSQWLRMHELLARRFKKQSWGHVLFHGGVPSAKRKDLVDQFRDDPQCRVFLATDAGGTGLNLQHASVVMNMDLPWNPAVLEQRVGRVHRLGQSQPVRVINFVAQGTIEQGMLDVIKFKRSLFAGVLDKGEKEVFLGGSRLNKFMEQVEATTTAIPEAMLEDAEEALYEAPHEGGDASPWQRRDNGKKPQRSKRPAGPAVVVPHLAADEEDEPVAGSSGVAPSSDPWNALLQTGMALLQQFTATPTNTGPRAAGAGGIAGLASSLLTRDERTGETYLKVPVAKPEVLDQAVRALGMFLESMRK